MMRLEAEAEKRYAILFGVLISTFLIQTVTRTTIHFIDDNLWTDQIRYVLSHDPKQFDLFGCYGHPGTTIIELASMFHLIGGISYRVSLVLSESVLIAVSTALCSVYCYLISPGSLWWLATALTLSLNRLYLNATPTTAVVMPFITLIVLASWWLYCKEQISKQYFYWGAVVGMAAATRIDVSLLIGMSMLVLIWFKHGHRAVLPMLLATGFFFILSNPYMWFMPMQHIADLMQKFTMHYTHFTRASSIDLEELFNTLWLTAICLIWSLFFIFRRQRIEIVPTPLFVVFFSVSFLALSVVLSSRFQAARYLFPVCTVWEVILPLYVLETLSDSTNSLDRTGKKTKNLIFVAISLLVFIQLVTYIITYINIPPVILI